MTRPRTRVTPSGFRVVLKHTIGARHDSPLGEAVFRISNGPSRYAVTWVHSTPTHIHASVDSVGVGLLRTHMAGCWPRRKAN